jgi:hypothetical protein
MPTCERRGSGSKSYPYTHSTSRIWSPTAVRPVIGCLADRTDEASLQLAAAPRFAPFRIAYSNERSFCGLRVVRIANHARLYVHPCHLISIENAAIVQQPFALSRH